MIPINLTAVLNNRAIDCSPCQCSAMSYFPSTQTGRSDVKPDINHKKKRFNDLLTSSVNTGNGTPILWCAGISSQGLKALSTSSSHSLKVVGGRFSCWSTCNSTSENQSHAIATFKLRSLLCLSKWRNSFECVTLFTLCENEGMKGSNSVARSCTTPTDVLITIAQAAGSSL